MYILLSAGVTMKTIDILKGQDFKQINEVKADSKNRVCIGKPLAKIYKVYQNSTGQIILDPQVTVPASEVWIYQNKHVLKLIQDGLEDAKSGNVRSSEEDFSKYISDEE